MRILYLQHVPFEPLGSIAPWAERSGHAVTGVQVYAGGSLPAQDAFDALIVMGGPMSVNDEDRHPWLRPETTFIEQTLKAAKPVMGICLGGQLIARVAGAAVAPNTHREIGWFPIRRAAGTPDTFLPDRATVFHWHGERFELPAGAVRLASSEGCDNQGFVLGDRVLAMQFHLEFTPGIVTSLAQRLADEVRAGGPYVQDSETMLADPRRFAALNRLSDACLDWWTGRGRPDT